MVDIEVLSDDEALSRSTNYSYTLKLDAASGHGVIHAASIYGAMYGMETLSQVVVNGTINATAVSIEDWPDYHHRSFMMDTGRRFWPVVTVKALIDAMGYNKMNVLHMHLSDNCRYAAPSKAFPQLTARLTGFMGGHYTAEDVGELVQYAGDRGIRVIAEADMPGHSQGMQGLSGHGLNFCSTNGTSAYAELRNDPAGQTIETLKAIYGELAALFPDNELFIGADETAPSGPCNVGNYRDIETAVADHILKDLNRSVGGWEEYAFETQVAQPSGDYSVNTWHYHTQFEATARGFATVASNDSHFYLVYGQSYASYWVDIASGMNETQRALLRGGSVSAWLDEYCYIAYCIHPGKYPSAHALFPPSADAEFHMSILGYSFPRAAVGAGSFWNHQPAIEAASQPFQASMSAMNGRLIARGVPSCPTECHCNAASRCGKPYVNESSVDAVDTLTLDELFALHPGRGRPGKE